MIFILAQGKYQNNSILPQQHYEGGRMMEKLDSLDHNRVKECTTSMMLEEYLESTPCPNQDQLTQSVMLESLPCTKKKTLNDKSNCCKVNTQAQKSLKTLVVDSIGTDKDLRPYWNTYTTNLSKQLWSPTRIDCADLVSTSYNGSLKNQTCNSWFSTRILQPKTHQSSLQRTFCQSLQSLLPEIMDSEQPLTKKQEQRNQKKEENKKKLQTKLTNEQIEAIEKRKKRREEIELNKGGKAEKAVRIKVYPTGEQKKTLNQWFGVRRWIYNKALTIINQNKDKKLTKKELRELVINDSNYQDKDQWVLNYEYDLRDEALSDLLKNLKSNLAKGDKFQLKYLSKKRDNSLSVLSKKWNRPRNFYSKIFKPYDKKGECGLKSAEQLPKELNYTSRLIKTQLNEYYLCIPQPLSNGDNQASKGSMIFIDPGVKTFLTGYDPSGKIVIWGKKDYRRIERLNFHKSELQSKITKEKKHSSRYRMKKALLRINKKVYNLVDELHKKLSKWLCSNYEYIFLPKLNFHECKKLNSHSKSNLASLRHCGFFDRLKNKSREYTTNVIEVNEAHTTKYCSNCGWYNKDIKNQDIFTCQQCNSIFERDINASKNIMLRYLTTRVKKVVTLSPSATHESLFTLPPTALLELKKSNMQSED